jgi:hypothetical protein
MCPNYKNDDGIGYGIDLGNMGGKELQLFSFFPSF